MMESESIRLLVVDADPGAGTNYQESIAEIDGVDIVGYARNKKSALELIDSVEFDVALVDVMLTGIRSIDVIGYIATTQPETHILALTPSEVPHDRVILALEAGALGYISKAASTSETRQAIAQVHEGKPWLVPEETLDVMRDSAQEMRVSEADRRDRLLQFLFSLLPITGLIAAFVGLMWREYWGHIGVRVVDLGVDPATRLINALVILVSALGAAIPLLFIDTWIELIERWIAKKPTWSKRLDRARSWQLGKASIGRVLFSRDMAWLLMTILILLIIVAMVDFARMIPLIIIGLLFSMILLANILGYQDNLPPFLRLSQRGTGRSLAVVGFVLFLIIIALGYEVLVVGPDLRPDGLHGTVAPLMLDLGANPVKLTDIDGTFEPIEALYLGGNADLYVLYDPCEQITRMVPVGSSRVEVIDKVSCALP